MKILVGLFAFVSSTAAINITGPFMIQPAIRLPSSTDNLATWNGQLNGGGVTALQAINSQWPAAETPATAVRHNLCGAQAGSSLMRGTGNVAMTFEIGKTALIRVETTDIVPGHFEFRLCQNASELSQACLNQHLLRIAASGRVRIDPSYPERFYVPASANQYDIQVQLPAGVECRQCVLQWYFVQADTCLPPGYSSLALSGYGIDTRLPSCTSAGQYPSEHWACADISIAGPRAPPVDESKLCNRNFTTGCKQVFGYVTSWSQYRPSPWNFKMEDIDASQFTHLLYAFATVGGDGKVTAGDAADVDLDRPEMGLYEQFHKQVRRVNPLITTLISIGGINFPKGLWSSIAASPSSRRVFIDSAIAWARAHGFAGIDIDWEFPAYAPSGGRPQDRTNFVLLLTELKMAIVREARNTKKSQLVLTAAVSIGTYISGLAYDIPRIVPQLDYILLMAYDLHGDWQPATGAHTALYSPLDDLTIDNGVQYWLDQGAPKEQLILGTASYGRGWTLASSGNTLLGAPASGASQPGPYTREAGLLSYFEIVSLRKQGFRTVFDDHTKTNYITRGNQWIGYDNPQTMAFKGQYVMQRDLAGAMMWSIDQDDYKNNLPLTQSLRANMRVAEPPESLPLPSEKKTDRSLVVLLASTGMMVLGVAFIGCMLTKKSHFESVDLSLDPGDVTVEGPDRSAVPLDYFRTELIDNDLRNERMERRDDVYFYDDDIIPQSASSVHSGAQSSHQSEA
eukprot:TRINITY_DN7921_c0_g1_i1.p1 TRINITY_DN7921_c0_g1~~TRINITY_DN7921_c0_g1_i1.p1  ORF type:complete len:739 (+),score=163.71 TRINITY_DN7921_c0_g1_i1:206-2422(+)